MLACDGVDALACGAVCCRATSRSEQQKAGSTGLDIASVFELRNEGVFGTAAGDLLGSAAWSFSP
jgi:hypothetical protein